MKLRTLLYCSLLSLAAGAPALGADLAVKAINKALTPVIPSAYPYQSSGLFFGVYTEGSGGSATATPAPGISAASLTTTDAGLGITLGYAWGSKGSNVAYSLEGDFGFTNFNGNNAGLALQGPLDFEQRFVVWTPTNYIAQLLPQSVQNAFGTLPPFAALQPGVTASNLQSGLAFGVEERDVSLSFAGLSANKEWLVEPVVKLLAMEQLSNGMALRAWAGVAIPTQGHIFGPIPGSVATLGPQYKVGVGAYF